MESHYFRVIEFITQNNNKSMKFFEIFLTETLLYITEFNTQNNNKSKKLHEIFLWKTSDLAPRIQYYKFKLLKRRTVYSVKKYPNWYSNSFHWYSEPMPKEGSRLKRYRNWHSSHIQGD